MSTNGSQKLDIADICDAVVNSIDGNVSDILSAANEESLSKLAAARMEEAQATRVALQEIVKHLRVITNEDFSNEN